MMEIKDYANADVVEALRMPGVMLFYALVSYSPPLLISYVHGHTVQESSL